MYKLRHTWHEYAYTHSHSRAQQGGLTGEGEQRGETLRLREQEMERGQDKEQEKEQWRKHRAGLQQGLEGGLEQPLLPSCQPWGAKGGLQQVSHMFSYFGVWVY